ncbi:MAG: hypothetical protein ACK5OX_06430 [Desertimonas sp.]
MGTVSARGRSGSWNVPAAVVEGLSITGDAEIVGDGGTIGHEAICAARVIRNSLPGYE